MGKWIFLAVAAIVVGIIGLTMFPSIKNILTGTDTTGFIPLTAAGVKALPYILVVVIGYAIYLAFKGKQNQ